MAKGLDSEWRKQETVPAWGSLRGSVLVTGAVRVPQDHDPKVLASIGKSGPYHVGTGNLSFLNGHDHNLAHASLGWVDTTESLSGGKASIMAYSRETGPGDDTASSGLAPNERGRRLLRAAARVRRPQVQGRRPQLGLMAIGLLAAALFAAACSGGRSQAPVEPAQPAPAPPPVSAPVAKPVPPPAVAGPQQPAVAAVEPAAPEQPALPESLFLEILEPADETVVTDSTLVVVGRTTPDAVVSVAEQTVDVSVEGDFVALVTLDVGPNVIEVAASDLSGTQETFLLAVIYLP